MSEYRQQLCQNPKLKFLDYLLCLCKLPIKTFLDTYFLFMNRVSKFLRHVLGQKEY